METLWVGERLMLASRELAERVAETGPHPGAIFLAPLAAILVREVGRSIAVADWDVTQPLRRTHSTWHLPTTISHRELATAFNVLGTIVQEYLNALPGATRRVNRFTFNALRHSAHTLLLLRHALAEGLPLEPHASQYGGLVRLYDEGLRSEG